ncbi:hypothetical protein DsansV1_C06g0059381 [Dioscorea sansibarensis]
MALPIHWYTILCFAIIAGAFTGALLVIWVYEVCRKNEDRETKYESLFLGAGDHVRDGDVIGVRSAKLWLSCWRGVHPAWLLMLRIIFPLVMIGIILWDMQTYDWTIMVYYTEDLCGKMIECDQDDVKGKGKGYFCNFDDFSW